ncbi:MAG: S-layer homology domain-containing protein [Candidatus Bipolaricaulaceae bacterium]
MRGKTVLAVIGVALVSVLGMTPGIAGGGGGTFLDVDPSHPAYAAIRYLVDNGIISVQATGGEFKGNQALLRYDAAQWLYRALQKTAPAQGTGDVTTLTNKVNALDAQVGSLAADVSQHGSELQSLRSSVSGLSREVSNLRAQAPGTDLAGRVQTNFVLGVTGVLLGVAAVAMAIFW